MKICIIGLGLIGGSLALALRRSGFATHIIGVDNNAEHQLQAISLGIVDVILPFEAGIAAAQVVIVATPVGAMLHVLPQVLDAATTGQIVMDVGSTKKQLLATIANHERRAQFIATHPMAGTEFSGPTAAITDLFEGKTCVLCDVDASSDAAHQMAVTLYHSLNMKLIYINADSHDVHTAYISHISHLSSFALALTVLAKEQDEEKIFELAGGGFQSTVRLAKSAAATWTPIFEQNRDNVLDVLDEHISVLSQFRSLLIKRNFAEITHLIDAANEISRILK